MIEDYYGVGLSFLGKLLELVHLLVDHVFFIEPQLQQGFNVASIFVLEINCEVLGEDFPIHDVDPCLFHEI